MFDLLGRHGHLDRELGIFLLAENKGHRGPDDDTQQHRADGPGRTHFRPQDSRRQDDGQDVDGRPGIEEGRSRTEARAHPVDAGEERQDGAGTDGEDGAGDRGHAIGQDFVGLGAQVFHHRGLADEDADRPGDEKGRDQTEQDMLLGIPFDQMEGLEDGIVKTDGTDRQIITGQKNTNYQQEILPLIFPVHTPSPFDCLT